MLIINLQTKLFLQKAKIEILKINNPFKKILKVPIKDIL